MSNWNYEKTSQTHDLPGVTGDGEDPADSFGTLVAEGFIILGDGVLSAETLMVAGLPRGGVL